MAGLRRQVVAGITSRALNGSTPDQLLADVRASLERMVRRAGVPAGRRPWSRPWPRTASNSATGTTWMPPTGTYLHELFDRLILPVVTPLTVDPSHPFPYISNLSLNVGVEVRSRTGRASVSPGSRSRRMWTACSPCPTASRFIPLEQVMVAFLDELFPGMEVGEACVFRVTRDADLALDDDAADDLLLALQEELRRRRFLPVVRLEIDSRTSETSSTGSPRSSGSAPTTSTGSPARSASTACGPSTASTARTCTTVPGRRSSPRPSPRSSGRRERRSSASSTARTSSSTTRTTPSPPRWRSC